MRVRGLTVVIPDLLLRVKNLVEIKNLSVFTKRLSLECILEITLLFFQAFFDRFDAMLIELLFLARFYQR